MTSDEKHRCDECSALCTEKNAIEGDLEDLQLCNYCYEDYTPQDNAEKLADKKDYLDQIAEDNYRENQYRDSRE